MSTPVNKNKNIRWGDWLSALLLVIIMQIAAGRLVATLWTKNLNLVQVTAFLGTLLGLALGKSVFRRFWVWLFTLAYGVTIIPWQLGLTLDIDGPWRERISVLGVRLGAVAQEILTRKSVTDSILFLLLMATLFWLLSVYAGIVLLREANPWKVVLPGGITVFVIHTFDPLLVSRSWYLAFYLFFALILVARLVFIKNAAKWQETRTHTPPEMSFDFTRVALILSMVIVFFAWNVPVVAETFRPAVDIWQSASRPWLSAKDRLSFMFASLRASVGLVQNFYGASLPLGLGTPHSDNVIFEVLGPTNPPGGDRFYWEARAYDTYDGTQWLSTISSRRNITNDSTDLNQPGFDNRPEVTFTFYPHEAISNLFTVPELLGVNIPSQAYLQANPDGSVDYSTLMSKDFVHPGTQYVIRSAIDVATITELQAAGIDYPEWVTNEYLQLPTTITPRTRELAKTIESDLTNPYDIANAVTDYLRNNIEYTQSIAQPPLGQERIDWFLFDYKKGFCNYYASAEVVLLRSLGIPARMGVGFAQGTREESVVQVQPPLSSHNVPHEYISDMSTYVVREKDAHAWPEVFFPQYGWIVFEPTVSQPPLYRATGESNSSLNERLTGANAGDNQHQQNLNENNPQKTNPNEATADLNQNNNFWTIGNVVKLIILLFALGIVAFVIWKVQHGYKIRPFVDRISLEIPERIEKGLRRLGIHPPEFLINWIYTMKLPGLSRAYLEINRALNRIGKKPDIQDTPSERVASLIDAIPPTASPAQRLLAEYQASVYSPHPANSLTAMNAGREIRYLSWIARINMLLSGLQSSKKAPESTFTISRRRYQDSGESRTFRKDNK